MIGLLYYIYILAILLLSARLHIHTLVHFAVIIVVVVLVESNRLRDWQ